MEEQHIEIKSTKDYLILAVFEALGTAILTVGMNIGYKTRPDAVSAGLFMAILWTYRVTGSHLNASVTLGVAITEKAWADQVKRRSIFAYLGGQLVGSYLGMLIVFLILGEAATMDMGPMDVNYSVFYVMGVEFIFSWIFLTIYMHAKSDWVAPS